MPRRLPLSVASSPLTYLPGKSDQSGFGPCLGTKIISGFASVRWSDGSFLYRRTWAQTVSTLTQDLLGHCLGQGRLQPVAGETADPEALVRAGQTSEPQAPDVPGDAPRTGTGQSALGGMRRKLGRSLQRPTPPQRT